MANLKKSIKQALKNKRYMDFTLNNLSKSQENLLKNHSNLVFNKKDKDRILKEYNNIQNIGEALYRYNTLKEQNYIDEAQKEKDNIENIVLKGGISYSKYIWHSENSENTCDVCAGLDGKVFDFYDEVPDRPHPNCKCYVEIVENDEDKSNPPKQDENEEPCDVIYEIENMISEMETTVEETEALIDEAEIDAQELENDISKIQNLIQEADFTLGILSQEYGMHLPDCVNNIDADYEYICAKRDEWITLLHDILGLLNPTIAFVNTVRVFVSNYIELLYHAYTLHEKEMDKFYHAKANCEATQQMGIIGQQSAELLSDIKEKYDQYTYVHTHKVTIEEAIADSERDQVADRLGRERGRKYPNCKCYELMSDLKPKHKK